MKVELIANLSANGQLVLAEQSAVYQAPQEIAGLGFAKAMECGNIVMGRTTYEMFMQLMKDVLSNLDVVVLSSRDIEDIKTVKTAEEAINYLETKGYEKVCVVGGTKTYNAFLETGLADELYFNLFPVVINGGGTLEGKITEYLLAEVKSSGDIAILHYNKK